MQIFGHLLPILENELDLAGLVLEEISLAGQPGVRLLKLSLLLLELYNTSGLHDVALPHSEVQIEIVEYECRKRCIKIEYLIDLRCERSKGFGTFLLTANALADLHVLKMGHFT